MDNREFVPEKVVIVAGPSFGAALKFMLLGAALGIVAVLSQQCRDHDLPATETGATTGHKAGSDVRRADSAMARLLPRALHLTKRVKSLAASAATLAVTLGTAVAPIVRGAVEEGKSVAHKTQHEIEHELKSEPDTVYATPSVSADQA